MSGETETKVNKEIGKPKACKKCIIFGLIIISLAGIGIYQIIAWIIEAIQSGGT